jgi:hypothetical protein
VVVAPGVEHEHDPDLVGVHPVCAAVPVVVGQLFGQVEQDAQAELLAAVDDAGEGPDSVDPKLGTW